MKINRKLKSVGKMQWVWYALLDSRHYDRFWDFYVNALEIENPEIEKAAKKLFPVLKECLFCVLEQNNADWAFDVFLVEPPQCTCPLQSLASCERSGRRLLEWLEGGCVESKENIYELSI